MYMPSANTLWDWLCATFLSCQFSLGHKIKYLTPRLVKFQALEMKIANTLSFWVWLESWDIRQYIAIAILDYFMACSFWRKKLTFYMNRMEIAIENRAWPQNRGYLRKKNVLKSPAPLYAKPCLTSCPVETAWDALRYWTNISKIGLTVMQNSESCLESL